MELGGIGLTGFEPATSWSRTNEGPAQTSKKQGNPEGQFDGLHSRLHRVARLFWELAALSVEERNALFALLGAEFSSAPPNSHSPSEDDDLPTVLRSLGS
jgi:hypothetical protein